MDVKGGTRRHISCGERAAASDLSWLYLKTGTRIEGGRAPPARARKGVVSGSKVGCTDPCVRSKIIFCLGEKFLCQGHCHHHRLKRDLGREVTPGHSPFSETPILSPSSRQGRHPTTWRDADPGAVLWGSEWRSTWEPAGGVAWPPQGGAGSHEVHGSSLTSFLLSRSLQPAEGSLPRSPTPERSPSYDVL